MPVIRASFVIEVSSPFVFSVLLSEVVSLQAVKARQAENARSRHITFLIFIVFYLSLLYTYKNKRLLVASTTQQPVGFRYLYFD